MFCYKSTALVRAVKGEEFNWLDFVLSTDYVDEFHEYCREVEVEENEISAYLFLEKKEIDSFSSVCPSSFEIDQLLNH